MRIDHHAYRRATGVAGFGLALQFLLALTLLLFSQFSPDTPIRFAAIYACGGLLVWLSLVAVFYQHQQERLESLETDELAANRAGSVFSAGRGDEGPAARRLRLMHKWLMPAVSLLTAAYFAGAAWVLLRFLDMLTHPQGTDFDRSLHRGWAVAICLAISLVAFIFSRFVAGMARHPAWQNLRGGAGFMVGNALVMLALTVGIIFRFFAQQEPEPDQPVLGITYAICVFMVFMAVEIIFNFILNLYRPRKHGEVPRPAFDSRVLSLLAAPESIVQSVSEAVNYQFGFDITSSWGYQLLLRSVGWLVAFAILLLVGLNMMVVVEPHQQAVKLSAGRLVGEAHDAGLMWKLPWPFESAVVLDVRRVRRLPLTSTRRIRPEVADVWTADHDTDTMLEPFLVGSSRAETDLLGDEPGTPSANANLFALVDAEIALLYRIKRDGLLDYLNFASEETRRRKLLNMRESAIKLLALREITQHLSRLSLEEVVAFGQAEVIADLETKIQATLDTHRTGIEVVRLNVPMMRPSGQIAKNWVDLAMAKQNRLETVARTEGRVGTDLALYVGDATMLDEIEAAVDRYRALRAGDAEKDEVVAARQEAEDLLQKAGGQLSYTIESAKAQRWITIMEARARTKTFEGQLVAYEAAPGLFKQRMSMKMIARNLGDRRKFLFIGIDPDVLNLDVILEDTSGQFGFAPQTGESNK